MAQIPIPRDLSEPLASSYDPLKVEAGWSQWWETSGFFTPQPLAPGDDREKFVIVIPPPNVTGSLHIGHALTVAIEDALVRYHRMKGRLTLYVPGVDHAGIATQSVVERSLLRTEGITRHELGRDEFLKKVWEWKETNGNHICYQLRRIGVSVDWTREVFTMDTKCSRAVTEAFVRLFDKGLIYRSTRLVSWCPHLRTALSEIEVDTMDIEHPQFIHVPGYAKTVEVGILWHFKYLLVDDKTRYIEVATTRIETMLGDVAVAVHPNDSRYSALVGKKLRHPFFPSREMVIVSDPHVDPEFGTGAVKITPAHDKNDYEIGQRHNLPSICIFTINGHIAETGGKFCGQHRFECRVNIERELKEMGFLVDKTKNPNKMQLPICSRSHDIIEYMLIPQWWVKCDGMAARAIEASRSNALTFSPSGYSHEATWEHWLSNIRDWCISRQLWWGHRIPAWRVVSGSDTSEDEIWIAARNETEAHARAEAKMGKPVELVQDEDVLDTWFSSGLFPFSVFGWPEETPDLKTFFPGTVLETGLDILFFWVARMVMMSMELCDEIPFSRVHLHGMVRDAHGKKMSKSLGNVVDPVEAIEGITLAEMHRKLDSGNLPEKEVKRAKDSQKKDFPSGIPQCGADALRCGLLAYTKQGRSINLDIKRVQGYRHFCNKLWNAVKFASMHFSEGFVPSGVAGCRDDLQWIDRWILHRLQTAAQNADEQFAAFSLHDAVQTTYAFWLYEFCDIYLETVKPRVQGASAAKRKIVEEVLYECIYSGLRMLHPQLPFVTEELYQRLPGPETRSRSICISPFPAPDDSLIDNELDKDFAVFMGAIREFRSLLSRLELPPSARPNGYLYPTTDDMNYNKFLECRAAEIGALAKLRSLSVIAKKPSGCVGAVASDKLEVWVDATDANLSQAAASLEKKVKNSSVQLQGYKKKLEAPDYSTKVPQDIQEANSEKMASLEDEIKALKSLLDELRLLSIG